VNVTSQLDETLVGSLLTTYSLTLAVAESCTGGLVGHRLTNVPGSSAYFLGGILSYSNEAKEHLLGVSHAALTEHGAVSEAVARAMAQGVRRVLGADIGLAVTGIAGPGGGTPAKPVGLTWIALCARAVEIAEQHIWSGDRESNKTQSADALLALLHRYLKSLNHPMAESPNRPILH
jgi:PncC family amidohydrolase